VVDDASRDQTLREAVRSKKFNGNTKNIKIFSYDLNQGKGFALYYGFQKSFGDIVVFADSDLDLPSKNITTVLNNLVHLKADIAIGSKRHPASQVHYPFLRRVQSKIYQILVQLLFNLNISDTQVGIKAFRRKVLEGCFPRIVVKQFAFDLELLVVANLLGYTKIIEAPIILNYHFSSTISLKSILKILQDTAAIFYRKNWLKYYQQTHNRLQRDKSLVSLQKAFI
jgi:glycosyltransferase involved in cell wall biosynthesis